MLDVSSKPEKAHIQWHRNTMIEEPMHIHVCKCLYYIQRPHCCTVLFIHKSITASANVFFQSPCTHICQYQPECAENTVAHQHVAVATMNAVMLWNIHESIIQQVSMCIKRKQVL
jgi:hypothetical protein